MTTQKKTPAGKAGVQLDQQESVPNERYEVIV